MQKYIPYVNIVPGFFISCEFLQNRDKGTHLPIDSITCSQLTGNFKKKEFAVSHVVHS